MFEPITIHSDDGKHFLGLRKGRRGGYEIIYDGNSSRQRFVWQIKTYPVDIDRINGQLREAIKSASVLSALYSSLRSAKIEFEIDQK